MIEVHPGGGISITGAHDMELFALISLKQALKLQEKGIKFWRGTAASTIARQRYGIKGKLPKQIEQVESLIEQMKAARAQPEPALGERAEP